MAEVVGFLLLLEDDIPCLGLLINLVFWVKSKGFESRVSVTEGTRTGLSMLVLSKLTFLDLSKLCVRLCLLQKIWGKHIFLRVLNSFEKHPCLCCMYPVFKADKLKLDRVLWKQKGLYLSSTKFFKSRLNPSRFVTACRPPCFGLLRGTLQSL